MKKALSTLLFLAANSSLASLSTPVKGTLTSFNYGTGEGYYLNITGDAAHELFTSIKYNDGMEDSMETTSEDPKTKLVTKILTIYSESMACSERITDLAPIGKNAIKYAYDCELTINKKGKVQTPARG